jgi:hypothetical protein
MIPAHQRLLQLSAPLGIPVQADHVGQVHRPTIDIPAVPINDAHDVLAGIPCIEIVPKMGVAWIKVVWVRS